MEHSPFADLPVEVRDIIYTHSISHDRPIKITTRDDAKNDIDRHKNDNPKDLPAALRFTCRRIYSESLKMFYATNTLSLQCSNVRDMSADLASFYEHITALKIDSLGQVVVNSNVGEHLIHFEDLSNGTVSNLPMMMLRAAKVLETCASLSTAKTIRKSREDRLVFNCMIGLENDDSYVKETVRLDVAAHGVLQTLDALRTDAKANIAPAGSLGVMLVLTMLIRDLSKFIPAIKSGDL